MSEADPTTSQVVRELQLNTDPIEELMFSPWTDPNAPQILVSLAREIDFWDIRYLLNNPFADRLTSPGKSSNRFKKRSQISPLPPFSRDQSVFSFRPIEKNGWQEKRGPSDRPELLACIRLIGKAKKIVANPDFSQFVSVDNEGEIYHLKLFDKDLLATTPQS